jgi:hypothetical protein
MLSLFSERQQIGQKCLSQYFLIIQYEKVNSSFPYSSKNSILFTPFSVTVGNMVCELHHSLCLALATENSISVITHLLKCLAALIQNTPYHRLELGLITKLVESVQSYLEHKGNAVAHCLQLSSRNLYFAYLSKFVEHAFGLINKRSLKAVNVEHASQESSLRS